MKTAIKSILFPTVSFLIVIYFWYLLHGTTDGISGAIVAGFVLPIGGVIYLVGILGGILAGMRTIRLQKKDVNIIEPRKTTIKIVAYFGIAFALFELFHFILVMLVRQFWPWGSL